MQLTDTAVRLARPKEKEYRLSDERGLLLVVRPNGGKCGACGTGCMAPRR